MESFRPGEATDALHLIEQAEEETYLPPDTESFIAMKSPALIAWALAGGVTTLTFVMWAAGNHGGLGIAMGCVAVGLFVGTVVSLEKKSYGVRPKAIMPRHVFRKNLQRTWPIAVAVGVATPAILWGSEQPRDLWVLIVIAVVDLAFLLGIAAVCFRFGRKQAT